MKIASDMFDSRIGARNLLLEIAIGDYEILVRDVIKKNEFQRRRVRSSKSVYALLKDDLLKHCIIPPIVLALTKELDFREGDVEDFKSALNLSKDHLVILDGLQRTYTIFDLLGELRASGDDSTLQSILDAKIRIEIYVGLNRLGILYRMLTLNTGQTPMSLRQQIEMLYLDYLTVNIDGIELIREADEQIASQLHQYNFKDVVEGFNAYLDRDELPIDKADILENINSLEKLSKENQHTDLFKEYLMALSCLLKKFFDLCQGSELSEDYLELHRTPFGRNVIQVFKRPQSISGFGAAAGKLLDYKALASFDEIREISKSMRIEEPSIFLEEINDTLFWLKNNSKKIGNAQRSYFTFFFRDLLNHESDTYCDPRQSVKSALRKYQAQNM